MCANTLSIAFSIDNGYANQLKVVLYSLFKSKKSSTVYNIYILAYDLNDDNFLLLEETVKRFDREQTSTLTHLSISKEDEESLPLFKNVHFGNEWGRETLYRLLLPKYLPQNIKRVLYLDTDILIQDDLSELISFQLSGKALAGVLDPIHFHVYGDLAMHNYRLAKLEGLSDDEYMRCFTKHGYVNAGILLLNIEYWRSHALDIQMISLLNRIYQQGHNYIPFPVIDFVSEDIYLNWSHKIFPDQDVINYLLLRRNLGEIEYLPMNYNLSTAMFPQNSQLKPQEWSARSWLTILHSNMMVVDKTLAKDDVKIFHFIGRTKPWHDATHPFSSVYQEYASQVDWQIFSAQVEFTSSAQVEFTPKSKNKKFKKMVKMLLPYGVVRLIQIIKSR